MFNQSLGSIFGLLFGDHLMTLGHGTVGAALVMNMNCVTLNFTGESSGISRIYIYSSTLNCVECIYRNHCGANFAPVLCPLGVVCWQLSDLSRTHSQLVRRQSD